MCSSDTDVNNSQPAAEPSSVHIGHPLIWDSSIELRLYQKNIAESAYRRNTMVILPTALGKTSDISACMCGHALQLQG